MVITGILMASVAIFGCKAIVWLNRLAIPGLVVLLAWLTYRIVTVYSDKLDSSQATVTNGSPTALPTFASAWSSSSPARSRR